MNIKQYMREGKSAMEVLYKEGQSGPTIEHYNVLPLPDGHVITYSTGNGIATYTVQSVISQEGSCSITYLMQGAFGDFKVLKEFCPKSESLQRFKIKDEKGGSAVIEQGTGQNKKVYQDYQLNYDKSNDTIAMAKTKFKEEHGRVKALLDMSKPDWEARARAMHLAVPYGDCFELHGNLYYMLEFVEGDSLFEYVRKKGQKITWEQKVSIMQQLCTALNYLHKESVHMDVSPFNIILKEESGSIHLTLIDFGLATSIIHKPEFGSLHGEGTSLFTDTRSFLKKYKKLHEIKRNPAPILVVDIYSIGMIWLYLLYADKLQKLEKTDMFSFIGNRRFYIQDDIGNAGSEWQKKAFQLVVDSVSYDDKREKDEDIDSDGYGPFHKRPKTAQDWFGQLECINKLKEPYITFECEEPLVIPANNEKELVKLTFRTNGNWEASADEWLKGLKPQGCAGELEFRLAAEPNKDLQLRGTKIKVKAKVDQQEKEEEIAVVQPGCGIVLQDGQSFKFLAEGETKLLKFKTGSDYSFSCNSDWLKSEEIEEQDGWHVIHLEAQPNDSTIDRYAEVHINCRGNEEVLQYCQEKEISEPIHEVKIKDGQQTCFSAEGGNYDLEIEATGSWTAKFEGSPEWIKMRKNYGTDNGKLQLHVNKNTSTFNKDKVKLSITLNDGKAQDFVFLSQEGRIDNPFDWKAWWQKMRIPTYVLSALMLLGGLYALWEWQQPVLKLQEESVKILDHNVTSTVWDFKAKDSWTAEVEDGIWVIISQRKGESGSHRLNVEFKENTKFAEREATIRLTCQDKSELLTIRQLYSRVDSLNYVLSEYRKQCDKGDKSGFNEIHMRLDRSDYRGVFRLKDGSYIGNNTYIIQGENKNCRIGDTHKVIAFKQNADSLFTEIIVAPINE